MKKLFLAFATLFSLTTNAQITSTKGGDIEFGEKKIVNTEKYDGSAATRAKLRMININNDTLILVNFNKDFDSDWMRFNFKKLGKIIEVNTSEVLHGLNYQKNLGSFMVKNNLIDTAGNINETAFATFAAKYAENLTEKYHALNEGNRLMATTKFDFTCEDNKIFVNGKHVGFIILPEDLQVSFKNVQLLDVNNKLLASGDIASLYGSYLKTHDKKVVAVRPPLRVVNCPDKRSAAIGLVTEMFRNGYYRG